MINYEFFRVANDEGPPVLFTYVDTDLTGWTLVMNARYREGPNYNKKLAIPATAVDLVNGQVKFEFSTGDLVEGVADVEFELTPASGSRFTVPACNTIRMTVRGEIG